MGRLESLEIARKAVEAASDKLATDIVLLDTRGVCSFADYFVLCSAESERQIDAIRDEIIQRLKKEDVVPHHEEGNSDSGWLLLDYRSVIIHIFALVQRDYYQLDKLWDQAPALVRIQ